MTYNACDIPNTVEPSNMRPLVYVPFAVQLCFFILRIASIWKRKKQPWGLDDITFYMSSALLLAWLPTLILENHFGYSRNLWTLQIWNIDNFTKAFFAFSLIYAIALAMIKISIVFLYLRVFRGKVLNYIVWATQAVNVAVAIIFIIGLFIVCQPLAFYWAYADDTEGTCHDYIDESGVYPGLNIFLDVWMIILPASQLWKLKITKKAKYGIMAMICLGLVTTAMTILRFRSVRTNPDLLLEIDLYKGLIYSVIEVTTAYVISCMPATRLLLTAYFPAIKQAIGSLGIPSFTSKRSKKTVGGSASSAEPWMGAEYELGGPVGQRNTSRYVRAGQEGSWDVQQSGGIVKSTAWDVRNDQVGWAAPEENRLRL